jgi:hypothetical protein
LLRHPHLQIGIEPTRTAPYREQRNPADVVARVTVATIEPIQQLPWFQCCFAANACREPTPMSVCGDRLPGIVNQRLRMPFDFVLCGTNDNGLTYPRAGLVFEKFSNRLFPNT